MLTTQRRNWHQYSESYTLSNMNSGTITYAANNVYVVTCDNLVRALQNFRSTQMHSSYVYWYAQKNSGYNTANP